MTCVQPSYPVSNKGNPAARAYIGTSAAAAAERDMHECMDYETEYEGYGCQVVQQYELTEKPLHTENAVFLHILSEHLHYSGSRS